MNKDILCYWHGRPKNMIFICSWIYALFINMHGQTENFAVTNPEALQYSSPGKKLYSFINLSKKSLHHNQLGLKNYTLWQTWREAPIFLTGRIGVDKRLAKETTFDNLRFLLFSCSGATDMSNEHTLTVSLILLLRFLCNNAVNDIHLSQWPRKIQTQPSAVKHWKKKIR